MGAVKTQDIPVALREWWKLFQKASYRHDYVSVFDDFITMTLTQFGRGEMFERWHSEAMRKYSVEEKASFTAMYNEIFSVFHEEIVTKSKPYFDMFGMMYETLSSGSKKSALGQFFTPECLVEMLVSISLKGIEAGQGKRILDPCSGSGRMIFIAHCKAPGNLCYAIDVDHLCAKMTALNMLLHGCIGEVVCGNALFLEHDWRWALSVNPILQDTGIPSLMPIEKDCSFIWFQDQQNMKNPVSEEKMPIHEKKSRKGAKKEQSQLKIF